MEPTKDYALEFDSAELIELPVTIGKKKFIAVEADGDTACKYRNRIIENTKLGKDGSPTSIKGIGDLDPFLVSQCLYIADTGGNRTTTRVTAEEVRKLPSRIMSKIADAIKEVSELTDAEDTIESLEQKLAEAKANMEEGKNESDETTDGTNSPQD